MTKTEKEYIKIMKNKTGQERLKIAMELREFVLKIAEEGIKDQNSNISTKDLKAKLQERIYESNFPF